MVTNQVNSRVRDIIIDAPHYGLILSSVNRYVAEKTRRGSPCPTAGVYKDGINMFMCINPTFWKTLDIEQHKFVLLHELLHICFMHPSSMWRFKNHSLFNIAADLEINQHVLKVNGTKGIDGMMVLKNFDMDRPEFYEKGTKWYYDYLQDEMDKGTKTGQKCQQICDAMDAARESGQPGQYDGHPTWGDFRDMTDSEQRMIEGQMKRQMARATQMNQKLIGNLPGTLKGYIDEIMNPKPTYDWKALFRRLYTGYADTTYTKKTRKRESIRFPGMPAVKIKKHSRVLCAIDTSGSISQDELVEFFTEVEGMRKSGVQIVVAECDTRIPKDGIYVYRNLNTIRNRQVTGGGGTDFNEPIEYLNQRSNQFNMLIYLTDGYASVPRVKSMKPIVWVLSRNGYEADQFKEQGFPGYIIKIQDSE